MWGLQLSVLSKPSFYNSDDNQGKPGKETSVKQKRQMISDAKAEEPRKIELVCSKNRYGTAHYKVPFTYYPSSSLFWEEVDPTKPATWITEL